MYCPNCGQPTLQQTVFCPNCGHRQPPPPAPPSTNASRPLWLRFLPLFLLIGLIAIGSGIWLGSRLLRPAEPTPIAANTRPPTSQSPATSHQPPATNNQQPTTSNQQSATKTPTPTDLPSTTPTASSTPIPPATTPPPTTRPPTITPSHTPLVPTTPAPVVVNCTYTVHSTLRSTYNSHSSSLGCPTNSGRTIWTAHENFQRGHMLWRQDIDQYVYVRYSNGTWARYLGAWQEGDPEYTCGTPGDPLIPRRGFGYVWCMNSEVQTGLGTATDAEWGEDNLIQDFANGIIWRHNGRNYVFFSNGTWR